MVKTSGIRNLLDVSRGRRSEKRVEVEMRSSVRLEGVRDQDDGVRGHRGRPRVKMCRPVRVSEKFPERFMKVTTSVPPDL